MKNQSHTYKKGTKKQQYFFNSHPKDMDTKKEKPSNFGTAVYIANKHGNNVPDEKLIEVAKTMNLKPKVLIKNYKSVAQINDIIGSLNAL